MAPAGKKKAATATAGNGGDGKGPDPPKSAFNEPGKYNKSFRIQDTCSRQQQQ